jgi:hypothetical protein
LIRDALVLRHRLPLIWARMLAGEVQAWRARRVAQTVLGAHADVVADIDTRVVDIVDKVGPATLDRLLDDAMLRWHAEEREIKQIEDLDARFVRLDEASITDTGVADLMARGDWKDLHDLDQALNPVAAALKANGCEESHDVRRSMALGVLADPAAAAALLGASRHAPPRHGIGSCASPRCMDRSQAHDPAVGGRRPRLPPRGLRLTRTRSVRTAAPSSSSETSSTPTSRNVASTHVNGNSV